MFTLTGDRKGKQTSFPLAWKRLAIHRTGSSGFSFYPDFNIDHEIPNTSPKLSMPQFLPFVTKGIKMSTMWCLVRVRVLVTRWCLTLWDPMDCEAHQAPGKNTGMGCHSRLQGIFLTQGLNHGLHFRQILHHLSHQSVHEELKSTICRYWQVLQHIWSWKEKNEVWGESELWYTEVSSQTFCCHEWAKTLLTCFLN